MLTVGPVIVSSHGPSMGYPMLSYISTVFHSRSRGQGLAEYALVLGLIAVVAISALLFLGTRVSTLLNTLGTKI